MMHMMGPNQTPVFQSDPELEEHVQKVKRWQGTQDAVEALVGLLNDRSLFEDVRRNAAYTLGEFPEEAATVVPALITAHRDEYRNVFEAAHWSLTKVDSDSAASVPDKWPFSGK